MLFSNPSSKTSATLRTNFLLQTLKSHMSPTTRLLPRLSANPDASSPSTFAPVDGKLRWYKSRRAWCIPAWQTQAEYHLCRLSMNTFLAAPMDMAMSPSKTLLHVPHRCFLIENCFCGGRCLSVKRWIFWHQGYITHFSINSLCWMYINLLSLLSSTCTQRVWNLHTEHLFLRLYTQTIYWQDSPQILGIIYPFTNGKQAVELLCLSANGR